MLTQAMVFPNLPHDLAGEVRRLTIQEKAELRMSTVPLTARQLLERREGKRPFDEPDLVQRIIGVRA